MLSRGLTLLADLKVAGLLALRLLYFYWRATS